MQPIIALICSVALEADPLVRLMTRPSDLVIGRRSGSEGEIGDAPVVLVVGGMGKTNAAQALTAVLELRRARAVIGFGVAGAYEGSGLEIGDIALASSEIYADEGVETPSGWASTREIGIPLLARGELELFNEFPVDPGCLTMAGDALAAAGIRHATGPFATVSCCSGTTERGRVIASGMDAICETMEGAAYAHVAALYEVPFVGVRGVSNHVVDRDPSAWRLEEAAAAAARAVARIVPGI
jgi:futalosine hydrolase